MSSKTTIADIARKTGFSPATISRALNHKQLVNPDTYNQIITAMKELGYRVPTVAVPAAQVEKRILVVNVINISNSFYEKIYRGIISSATNHGWYVMVTQEHINEVTFSNFLKLLRNCNAIGLILFDLIDKALLDALIDILPTVQCCEFDATSSVPYIGIDNFSAAVTLMEYLISHNHRRIALVNGPRNLIGEAERQRGYEYALEKAGIGVDPQLVVQLPASDYFMGRTFVQRLLQSRIIPDAVFAVSDILAFAAINTLKEFGLSVPGDVSVIGFDNISLSEMSSPKISTVNHPCFEIGFLSSEMIHRQYTNRHELPDSVLLNTELILRESTR